ncbi:zf-TFIIB domain-containing protein [Pseudanabaena sp. PCC 6802]|uniref:TFIIB-type zinc ribbon-containing protein n=1 Tax=Pseudanabaena sp. PCC 6802 TaxID=118173 RepID=UPI000345D3AD|nr:zf-TFIIB domain-containing protein [Pseudanabaena sp. PCC 6802]
MLCPVCNVDMRLADREGIEIDYCPQCRGIWLDRGELEKIVERSTAAPYESEGDRDRSRHGQEYRGDKLGDRDRRERKRGFLEDLFDF